VAAWEARAVGPGGRHLLDHVDSPLAQWLVAQAAPSGFAWPASATTSTARWAAWAAAVGHVRAAAAVLWLAWPVMDKEVLTQTHHLSKVPFSLHATTRRVALPLAPDALAAFDPRRLPTAGEVVHDAPGARAQLAASRRTWDAWLDACAYPPA
jgi:hypothetical protein